MSNKKDEQLVRYFKQSNSIIEARYKLKYVEKCVFSKAYMMVEEKDLTDPHKTYRIYIKDLIRDFGLSNEQVTETTPKLTFSGIGVYQPTLFAKITRGNKAPLAPLLREQIAQNKISGEHHAGFWIDVGTPQRLQQLDDFLLKIN